MALLQATGEFLILRAVIDLKSFGFSCMLVGQQYSFNIILVSYLHFGIFGTMADIFLLVFDIFCQPILAVFKFPFSYKIIILNLCRNFLIKMNVLLNFLCV